MITVNPETFVITIPQSYLTLDSGTLYRLDTDRFRKDLKAWEASFEGMYLPKTHDHVTEISISGTTFVRFIVILDPYSVEFEDGQYSVILEGSNNNIGDVAAGILVQNQVQVIPTNSAGNTVTAVGSGVLPSDIAAITSGVWEELGASHVTASTFGFIIQQIRTLTEELHRIQGLDINNPAVGSNTNLTAGNIDLEITGDCDGTTIVTRQ